MFPIQTISSLPRNEDLLLVDSLAYPLVNPDEIVGQAWAAMQRRDSEEALRLWGTLRREFPERAEAYIWPIQVLWEGGRLDEAETIAAEAFARFPENPEVLVQYGWVATSRPRWDEALRWWEAVRLHAPERVEGYLWATRALWRLGRLDEANALARVALDRFAGNADVVAESAWVAVNRNDWDAALQRWKLALKLEPQRRDAQLGQMHALRCLGQAESAERMAREALARHPGDPDFLIEHIWCAIARGDWTAAKSRLEAARGDLQQSGRFEEIRGAADRIAASELMLSFESLGEQCDFGAVQRHYGVNPLGLLRFTSCPLDALLAALSDRFEVIGSPEDTHFSLYGDETILTMKKYGMHFHTFVYDSELRRPEKFGTFQEQQRRRLTFLKEKLIADLEDPQKIFVYSSDDRVLVTDAIRLFTALRAYGPNALLYVRPADAEHTLGTVEVLRDGLYLGHYPGLTDFLGGKQPPLDLWRQLCERTYRLALSSGFAPLLR